MGAQLGQKAGKTAAGLAGAINHRGDETSPASMMVRKASSIRKESNVAHLEGSGSHRITSRWGGWCRGE